REGRGLRQRAVDHALGAELALEVVGQAEDAAVDAHVLPEDEDVRVALHLLAEREVEGLDHGQLRQWAHIGASRDPFILTLTAGWSAAPAWVSRWAAVRARGRPRRRAGPRARP